MRYGHHQFRKPSWSCGFRTTTSSTSLNPLAFGTPHSRSIQHQRPLPCCHSHTHSSKTSIDCHPSGHALYWRIGSQSRSCSLTEYLRGPHSFSLLSMIDVQYHFYSPASISTYRSWQLLRTISEFYLMIYYITSLLRCLFHADFPSNLVVLGNCSNIWGCRVIHRHIYLSLVTMA